VQQAALSGGKLLPLLSCISHVMEVNHNAASPTCRVLDFTAIFKLMIDRHIHGFPPIAPSAP